MTEVNDFVQKVYIEAAKVVLGELLKPEYNPDGERDPLTSHTLLEDKVIALNVHFFQENMLPIVFKQAWHSFLELIETYTKSFLDISVKNVKRCCAELDELGSRVDKMYENFKSMHKVTRGWDDTYADLNEWIVFSQEEDEAVRKALSDFRLRSARDLALGQIWDMAMEVRGRQLGNDPKDDGLPYGNMGRELHATCCGSVKTSTSSVG